MTKEDLSPYNYVGLVVSVYDGDTVRANIDRGHDEWTLNASVRLAGIDTPELRGGTDETKDAAKAARDYLRERVLMKKVVLRSIQDRKKGSGRGKYGRYLFEIFIEDGDQLISVNRELLDKGHARPYGEHLLK